MRLAKTVKVIIILFYAVKGSVNTYE